MREIYSSTVLLYDIDRRLPAIRVDIDAAQFFENLADHVHVQDAEGPRDTSGCPLGCFVARRHAIRDGAANAAVVVADALHTTGKVTHLLRVVVVVGVVVGMTFERIIRHHRHR